ncbi:helix-turn-helix domain-containing protein [Epilithonimonas sp.]|uniref:helix-turn-helix domain-containing protein n=1 Tax=Epilithonimonas sp. TaxID=2894511 RepID=UPI00289B2C3B|nr:helix-turn-helix domain-containing protein [Epilithonimonas sp.]
MKKTVAEMNNDHKENNEKQWIIMGVLVLLVTAATIIFCRRKNKLLRKNHDQMIEMLKQGTLNESNPITKTPTINQNSISSDTEKKILSKLEAFETSDSFIKKDLTISYLSNQWNTNPKYLSDVIRRNKGTNFTNHVNQLRIPHIVQKLYNEPKYRDYKVGYLADECGFNSPQVFIIAFKKLYGVTSFYFIQQLNNGEVG